MDLLSSDIEQQELLIVVTPLLKKVANAAMSEPFAEDPQGNEMDDSPFERTLCATWDLSTVTDYAVVMYRARLSRMLLKIASITTRVRTRELAMGILANLSCHYDRLTKDMVYDMDLCNICRSILWHENDAHVLLETTRLLSNFYMYGNCHECLTMDQNGLIFLLMPTDDILPSMIHQITTIVTNTLHTQLLLTCLQLLIRIMRFLFNDNRPIDDTANIFPFAISQMKQNEVAKLVNWGLDRLEEQSRGVGIGMGLNRSIAVHVMQLLWLFFDHDMVTLNHQGTVGAHDCLTSDILTHRLKPSMETIVTFIQQEEDLDKSSDDTEIEQLAEALSHFTIA